MLGSTRTRTLNSSPEVVAPRVMRFLGIDHGSRRLGLAYGDEIGVATPLPAILTADPAKQWEMLGAVIRDRRITAVVLGLPLNMDGTEGPKAKEITAFAAKVRSAFGIPVHFVDERLTSYEAESTIPAVKRRSLRNSGLVDSRAACIILQDHLDQVIPSQGDAPPGND
jgi:putative holliday junction resolvase